MGALRPARSSTSTRSGANTHGNAGHSGTRRGCETADRGTAAADSEPDRIPNRTENKEIPNNNGMNLPSEADDPLLGVPLRWARNQVLALGDHQRGAIGSLQGDHTRHRSIVAVRAANIMCSSIGTAHPSGDAERR
ncbi:hypothetical protein RHRU231_30014 [Rhodococcus ruber]|uniref:Uncharacterized protein n=1 Tax=Rhodococcus ruber TaxID=1830 RepID=A0A098BIE5_9NOCA|nr:hypothetical protein RHRU231_30014 [Rhodococcus ruber]